MKKVNLKSKWLSLNLDSKQWFASILLIGILLALILCDWAWTGGGLSCQKSHPVIQKRAK